MGKNFEASWNVHKEVGHLTIKIICIVLVGYASGTVSPDFILIFCPGSAPRRVITIRLHEGRLSLCRYLTVWGVMKKSETVTGYEGSQWGIQLRKLRPQERSVKKEPNHLYCLYMRVGWWCDL